MNSASQNIAKVKNVYTMTTACIIQRKANVVSCISCLFIRHESDSLNGFFLQRQLSWKAATLRNLIIFMGRTRELKIFCFRVRRERTNLYFPITRPTSREVIYHFENYILLALSWESICSLRPQHNFTSQTNLYERNQINDVPSEPDRFIIAIMNS